MSNELARFIDMATGSASEVECQLLLAKDLGDLPKDQHTVLHQLKMEFLGRLG